jgi:cytochrome c-type biogenesis protein CcmF
MIIHPPMLYLGFTGFTIPYIFAMAALMSGKLDDHWFRTTRRWTLVAWLFLSLGLILGGRWAYDVLGWGVTGPGTRWKMLLSCPGWPARPFSIQS